MNKSLLRLAAPFCATAILLTLSGRANARVIAAGTAGGPTLTQAIAMAGPGDTVTLPPGAVVHDSVVLRNKSGAAGAPLVIDGQGATLDGSEPLRPAEWTRTKEGLFQSAQLPARMRVTDPLLGRIFFIRDGVPLRMGRAAKNNRVQFKAVEDLKPGEWTYSAADKSFWINAGPEASPSVLSTIRVPILNNGVSLIGDSRWVTIRNLRVRHFWNDGFNAHGECRDIVLENIAAEDCGDDGLSAHGDCQVTVRGFVASGNTTGICHVGKTVTATENFQLTGNLSFGIYLLDESRHQFSNGTVTVNAESALRLTGGTQVTLDKVKFVGRDANSAGILLDRGAVLKAAASHVWNIPFTVTGAEASWTGGTMAGPATQVSITNNSKWTSNGNIWDVPAIFWGGTRYGATSFPQYVAASGQDKDSRVQTVAASQYLHPAP